MYRKRVMHGVQEALSVALKNKLEVLQCTCTEDISESVPRQLVLHRK